MSLAELLGVKEVPKIKKDEEWKKPTINPFEFVTAIQQTGEQLIVDEWSEKQYNPYIVNRAMSMGMDTIFPANEMNQCSHAPKKAQFAFYVAFVKKHKRYNKWMKAEVNPNLKLVQDYYGFSLQKARVALMILTEADLDYMKDKMRKGGTSDE